MSLRTFLWIFLGALVGGLVTFLLFEYFAPEPLAAPRDGQNSSQQEAAPEE